MRHDNLITVFATLAPALAEAARDLLRAGGIPCFLGGILRARALGVPDLDIQVKVPAGFAAAARQLIETLDMTLNPSPFVPPPLPPARVGPGSVSPNAPEQTASPGDGRVPLDFDAGAPKRKSRAASGTGGNA